ncbi:hypothetical protein Kpho02_18990 [Kitasatospora phosalacinea]|uniref:Uncharacterized protein n=1 Tax=Kitasatospora phosalacinea TaxID=2065 RepID=A0A9W6Q3T9_9ACTN|nr:hypothetical protein [Kitasatospora phosalacinea]GLW69600.1 hypothetical protein Kpho02_18990 [Kitasatospora phosalacinea]
MTEEIGTSGHKPKDLVCPHCHAGVEAVHAGTAVDDNGRSLDRWQAGPCHNPQCSQALQPRAVG